jgi:aromatic-L-amino-acid/L-tryptophan decarboxylase
VLHDPAVPLGVGQLLTRHGALLAETFGTGQRLLDADAVEPFDRSIRWSRSFAGLKLLLSLAVIGWRGFEESLRRQVGLGERLRRGLALSPLGWRIVNDTPLPVVCFVPDAPAEQCPDRLRLLARLVAATGQARVFVVRIDDRHALRACITNHETTAADIDLLVQELDTAAAAARGTSGPLAAAVANIPVDVGACQGLRSPE